MPSGWTPLLPDGGHLPRSAKRECVTILGLQKRLVLEQKASWVGCTSAGTGGVQQRVQQQPGALTQVEPCQRNAKETPPLAEGWRMRAHHRSSPTTFTAPTLALFHHFVGT